MNLSPNFGTHFSWDCELRLCKSNWDCQFLVGLTSTRFNIVSSWWFFTNPSEKYARSSNWIMKPVVEGVKLKKKIEITT